MTAKPSQNHHYFLTFYRLDPRRLSSDFVLEAKTWKQRKISTSKKWRQIATAKSSQHRHYFLIFCRLDPRHGYTRQRGPSPPKHVSVGQAAAKGEGCCRSQAVTNMLAWARPIQSGTYVVWVRLTQRLTQF